MNAIIQDMADCITRATNVVKTSDRTDLPPTGQKLWCGLCAERFAQQAGYGAETAKVIGEMAMRVWAEQG